MTPNRVAGDIRGIRLIRKWPRGATLLIRGESRQRSIRHEMVGRRHGGDLI